MVFPGVILINSGVNAALRSVRVAANGMHFGDYRHVGARRLRGQAGTQPGKTGANDQDIVLIDGHSVGPPSVSGRHRRREADSDLMRLAKWMLAPPTSRGNNHH